MYSEQKTALVKRTAIKSVQIEICSMETSLVVKPIV